MQGLGEGYRTGADNKEVSYPKPLTIGPHSSHMIVTGSLLQGSG